MESKHLEQINIKDFISELDTDRFGFRVAKVNDFSYGPEKLLFFLKENNVELIISKVDSQNIKLVNILENLKFCIKDIQVTYKFDLTDYKINSLPFGSDFVIRDFKKTDISQFEKIALESFRNYGHYSEDERLDPKKCNEIYVDWIRRSCEDENIVDKIIVAEFDEEIAGFLSFKIYNNNNSTYAVGGLGAVSEKYRNRDVFRMITIAGLDWGKGKNLDWEEHNVLITNYPVNRSFSKIGFKISRSLVTMHHWIEK